MQTPASSAKKIAGAPSGFTLLELLLYVVILSTALLGIFLYSSLLLRTRIKNHTLQEVEQQGLAAAEQWTQDARNATAATVSTGALDLTEADASTVHFALASDALTRTANDTTVALTSKRVKVTNFTCTALATAPPASIQCSFTLSYVNTNHRPEYDYTRTFTTSVTLRNR